MRQLIVPRFALAEHKRAIWQATIEQGVTFEEVIDPAFWSHVANKIEPYSRIECVSEDGTYFAELMVMDVGMGFVKTSVLRFVELMAPTKVDGEHSKYEVRFQGPYKKHVVIRKEDGMVLKEGMSKVEANEWLTGHVKSMA